MSRPVRNRKVVNYSQFQESDDGDEGYGRESERPKKMRASPREVKHKKRWGKNSQEDSDNSDDQDSKSKNDSADDFGSEEDNDFAEEDNNEGASDYDHKKTKRGKRGKNEKTSKRAPKRKRAADDSDEDMEVSKKVRQVRQAASKAVSKQREMLLGDAGSEDEDHDDDEQACMDQESGSDEDFMVDDDDDSDYGQSKKRNKKVIRKTRPDRKKSPKPRLKATVSPSPIKTKGKGRPSGLKVTEKSSPKEEVNPESPNGEDEDDELEKKDFSPSKKTEEVPEDENDVSEEEAPSGED